MKRLLLLVAVLASVLAMPVAASAQARPEFKLGFKALADQIPDQVGEPVENEYFNTSNGNAEQHTTKGLMVWRKADNWTAYTNGATTWINGPNGVESRPNSERFEWEKDPPASAIPVSQPVAAQVAPAAQQPAPTATATPAPQRGPFKPEIKAMDERAGGPAINLKARLSEVDEDFARTWGWRPSKAATVYLYSTGAGLAEGITQITGQKFTDAEKLAIGLMIGGVTLRDDPSTGGYAVVMNVGHYTYGQPNGDAEFTATMVHEYTHVMQADLVPGAGKEWFTPGVPSWFTEGMAEVMAYTKAPTSPARTAELDDVRASKAAGYLPTVRQLQNNWRDLGGSFWRSGEAYGIAYLAVKHLTDRMGGMPLRQVMEKVAAGSDFDSALVSVTGYTVERLDAEYKANIHY